MKFIQFHVNPAIGSFVMGEGMDMGTIQAHLSL